jgi:hypothetical protein
VLGSDQEIGAHGHLAAPAESHAVDRREDRLAQVAQLVVGALEDPVLARPLLGCHAPALLQVAAGAEGAVAGTGQDGDADGRLLGDLVQDFAQAHAHARAHGVQHVGAVEGQQRDRPVALQQDGIALFGHVAAPQYDLGMPRTCSPT